MNRFRALLKISSFTARCSCGRQRPAQKGRLGLSEVSVIPILLLSILLAYTHIGAAQQQLAGDVTDQFCRLDVAGKRLNPVGAREAAKLLLKENAWAQPSEVLIIKNYSVRESAVQKGNAEFAVDYEVLGRIDSSLGFTHLQVPYTYKPTHQSENFSLVLSDTHFELGADGQLHQVKGIPEWRIKTAPQAPHVSLQAAMSYVRAAGWGAKGRAAKIRAQKTLVELERLAQAQAMPEALTGPSGQMPEAVLSQMIEMQADGAGLAAETPTQLDVFFVHPAPWRRDRIGVARTYVVKRQSFSGSQADAYVEYAALGELDSQLRFVSRQPNENVVRQDYKLVFDAKYVLPARGNVPAEEFTGPSRWRVADAPAEQWISVAAAIRYVSQVRQTSTDPAIKANADKTLAALAGLR